MAVLETTPNASAFTTDYAFTQIPSRFTTRTLTVGSRALGEICLSRDVMPEGDVCNPAWLGENPESSLLGQVFIGNGYAALSTVNQFLFQPLTQEFLQSLFSQQNATSLELNAGLVFTTRHFQASFVPYRVQYISEVHNPNFPVVAVHASIERDLVFSGGGSLEWIHPKLRYYEIGANLRLISRTYVHGQFNIADVVTTPPDQILPVLSQKAFLIDPSIGWHSPTAPWHLRVSFGAVNVGKTWPDDPLYPEDADLRAGVGVEPPVGFGTLKLGVDFTNLLHGQNLESRFQLGGSYRFGILELMTGLNQYSYTAGVEFGIDPVKGGIVYEFIRSDIETATPESRIATEVAIRL